MKHFLSVTDVSDIQALVAKANEAKSDPWRHESLGHHKTLGLLFFNPSLRTRLSTVKAAQHLGMKVLVMNVSQDSWQLETEDGVVMDGGKAEHVKEAAAVVGQYCDIISVRSFPTLVDREADYAEKLLHAFVNHSGRPVVNMESSTVHPLQSLADVQTIEGNRLTDRPKVVMSWAPHIKALPQAVPNSFAQWMAQMDYDFVITAPDGFELAEAFTNGVQQTADQEAALKNADFVYVKNWSSFHDYGAVGRFPDWCIDGEKMALTNNGRFMHCLPVRRNVVVSDQVLDDPRALHLEQANNRLWAAQAVLQSILEDL
ncbi:MAG: N-acetylornithine carbamoyltransferase [Bacteroidota bacterium]